MWGLLGWPRIKTRVIRAVVAIWIVQGSASYARRVLLVTEGADEWPPDASCLLVAVALLAAAGGVSRESSGVRASELEGTERGPLSLMWLESAVKTKSVDATSNGFGVGSFAVLSERAACLRLSNWRNAAITAGVFR